MGGQRKNARHKLHWQCRDAPVSSWHWRLLPSEPCIISSCDFSYAVLQDLIRSFDSAPPSCHVPEPPYFCMRVPTRDPPLYHHCTAGRVGYLVHKLDRVVTTEDTCCCTWRVPWTWVARQPLYRDEVTQDPRASLQTSMFYKLKQSLVQGLTHLQRSCNLASICHLDGSPSSSQAPYLVFSTMYLSRTSSSILLHDSFRHAPIPWRRFLHWIMSSVSSYSCMLGTFSSIFVDQPDIFLFLLPASSFVCAWCNWYLHRC